jgi:hypothetical protein
VPLLFWSPPQLFLCCFNYRTNNNTLYSQALLPMLPEVRVDTNELEDCRWFNREWMLSALAGRPVVPSLPLHLFRIIHARTHTQTHTHTATQPHIPHTHTRTHTCTTRRLHTFVHLFHVFLQGSLMPSTSSLCSKANRCVCDAGVVKECRAGTWQGGIRSPLRAQLWHTCCP